MEDHELTKSEEKKTKWEKRRYFFRQMMISSGGWTCYFIMGMSFGASTVFIPQIRKEAKSDDAISESTASWIPAIMVYSGLPWTFILPIFMKYIGRKYTYMFVSVSNLVSFLVFYLSANVNQIIISQVINGINTGSHFTVSVMIITEYTAAKHRGFFLTVKSATLFWGIFMSNAIGTFFHWRNIGIAGIVCSAYGLLISIVLPESPFWLATKQRFEKCSFTHRWMMGHGKQAEEDLKKLITYQKNLKLEEKSKNFELKSYITGYWNIVSSRQFYKPLLLCLLVNFLYIFSGKVVFSVYAIDILSKITAGHHISPYTAMLVLDGVTVFCMYVGCLVAKVLPRKKLLTGASLVGIAFLLAISLYAYLIKLSLVAENNNFAMFLLIGYSMGLCFGPVILTQTITGELVSIEARGLSSCCIDLSSKMLLGTLVKISPFLFKTWGTHGAFLFFGLSTTFFLFLIYVFLPETKDMTLQEIAEWMKGNKKSPALPEETNFLPPPEKN